MQLCNYAKHLGCTLCDKFYYTSCKKFNVAHAAFLTRNIRPFKYNSSIVPKDNVVTSKSDNVAKSAALYFALKTNSEVKKLTISQVLSIVINNQDVEGKVFYIDYSQKAMGDPDKIKGVLNSFVDNMLMKGAFISIHVTTSALTLNLEYTKL